MYLTGRETPVQTRLAREDPAPTGTSCRMQPPTVNGASSSLKSITAEPETILPTDVGT